MSNSSAILGNPPNNQDDFFIVRGIFRSSGLFSANASRGWITVPEEPAGYVYETKQPGTIAGMVVVILLISIVTATRLALRYYSAKMVFGADDWVILAAASIAVTYPILQILMVVQGGAGHHVWEVTYEQYNIYAYYGRVCQILFYIAVGMIKISITLFIRRIVDCMSRFWTIITDLFLALLVAYVLLAIFWQVLLCSPPRASWDRWYAGSLDAPASCLDNTLSVRSLRIAHLVLGVLLLLTPVVILWNVRMRWQKKARLFLIWATGALSVIGGLLQQLQSISSDSTWSYTDILVWTCLDLCMGTTTASLPVMDGWLFGSWGATVNGGASSAGAAHAQGSVATVGSSAFRRPAVSGSTSQENFIRVHHEVELTYTPTRSPTGNPFGSEAAFSKHDRAGGGSGEWDRQKLPAPAHS
ncbi:hypothetical protein DHEL01_v203795 [Diaporthe helianthi]|uniref:Rhodopsin domain-containing protein n=1 Tax=Diaporthe helianthi TaxID=158607 RepID=A0A2P5I5P9_DIAHE|nr:hypothetical protein DHEL01_v203795 [Diaporthe helianthi]